MDGWGGPSQVANVQNKAFESCCNPGSQFLETENDLTTGFKRRQQIFF